jgi:hypothetical protein
MSDEPRMVRHVVLVKFRDDASNEQKAKFIRHSQWSLGVDYVSGYVSGWPVEPNPYAGSATESWDWAMTLDITESDVERYKEDPLHTAVDKNVTRCAERYAILDFVID